jgi:hypothetical protein
MAIPPLQNFIDKVSVVATSWLNAIDVSVSTILEQATTKAAGRTALTADAAFEIANGGTSSRTGKQLVLSGTDSGVVNVYTVAFDPSPTLTAGMLMKFTPLNTNTGAVTINGTAVLGWGGVAMTGGELSSVGPAVFFYTGTQWQLVATVGAQPGYQRTAAEIAAGVTPTNYVYPPGDARRYGADLTGVADSTAALQAAINSSAGAFVYLPNGTYKITSLTAVANLRLTGQSRNGVTINASTAGVAFDGYGFGNLWLEHFSLNTSNDAATGIRLGNGVQHIGIVDVALVGSGAATNSGAGLLLNSGTPGAFSGNLVTDLFYIAGYKFGIQCIGNSISTNTWTSMSFHNTYVLGRSAGIIAGSIGLWMDANTNGVGSTFVGGTIESFATGVQVDTGGYGLHFFGDLEGNTTSWTVGSTFAGFIRPANSVGNSYEQAVNGATNRWYQRQQLNGVVDEETYYGPRRTTIYDDSGTEGVEWALYRGPQSSSFISGTANPTKKFAVRYSYGATALGNRHWIWLNGNTIHWDNQSPATSGFGTWAVGDICLNTSTAIGAPIGWICTVAGTQGTWTPLVQAFTQVTGFGTPTGAGVINNFPGATATLAQCSQAIAEIIKDLKSLGLYGA